MLSRTLKFSAVAAASFFAATSAFAQNATTRIETRPFYGATVTIEEGVRVFRGLPADRHVIINPGGQTPLSLGFNETRVYENSQIHNYEAESSSADRGGSPSRVYGGFGFGRGDGFGRGYGKGRSTYGGGVGGGGYRH